jgi:hypothetical protein
MIGAITAGLFSVGAPPAPAFTSDYESIASLSGTGSSGVISFTSIPSTFKHLQVRFIGAVSGTGGMDNPVMRFNNDSATNYSAHRLNGDGASASADAFTTVAQMRAGFVNDSSNVDILGVGIIDILEYGNTNIYKTFRILSGVDRNGIGFVGLGSGNWRSTTAINRVDLIVNGLNWTADSRFALYGIKG